ncbi:MAG: glycosyltransferase [Mariprofundaceae bacterium]
MSHPLQVSILIITRDRREMLGRLLGDLHKQKYEGEFEIVVVEETDSPKAPDGVSYFSHPMRNKGIAFARNMALEHANHDLLVFVDDDCRVEPEWLSRLVAVFSDASVLGVQGGVTVPEETNAIGWAESLLGFPGGGVTRIHEAAGHVQNTLEISTLNAAYRKSAVQKVGGFPAEARFGGEDYILAKRVSEHGELQFVPDAAVQHEARGSVVAIWHWFVRRGRAEFELWRGGLAPEGFGAWMLRASLTMKLIPLVLLSFWTAWPLLGMIVLMAIINMWRYRWVLHESKIPNASWWCLPWVRLLMGVATDFGRLRAWLKW